MQPQQHYQLFETAFGVCGIAWSEHGLSRVQLPERDLAATKNRLQKNGATSWDAEPPPHAARGITQLQSYFAGTTTGFIALSLDDSGITEFNQRIYRALRAVPFGQTTTYGALAQSAGSPGAAQAVGTAMSRNPWPVIVPCHRVLAAAQAIGGFSAFGGAVTKRHLLRHEGVDLDHGQLGLPGF